MPTLYTNFGDFLKESNNSNKIIYHFTENIDSLLSILDTNMLMSGANSNNISFGRGYDNISFTWNPNLWDIEYLGDTESRYKVRISFDYDEMSKKWNFKPFDYGIEEEMEEIVELDEMFDIIKYIKDISISSIEPKIKVNNIKFKYPALKIKVIKRNK